MTTLNRYDIGDLVRVSAAFSDVAGAAIDPTNVAFKFKDPAGAVTAYVYATDAALVRDSAGNYHVDVSVDSSGRWHYRWESTGAGQAAEEGQFIVDASGVLP
jgi:hypothetical protein